MWFAITALLIGIVIMTGFPGRHEMVRKVDDLPHREYATSPSENVAWMDSGGIVKQRVQR
jgi:hypothetical protein